MFKSKFFTGVIVLTFLAMAATVVFQVLEMNDYHLFQTMLGSK
jgi:hypothetical protein